MKRLHHRPALAHRVACATLLEMETHLRRQGMDENIRANHPMVFETLFLLVGDELRRAEPPRDLGLQTVFRAPLPGRKYVSLQTVRTILRQCIEEGWMFAPGLRRDRTNYRLSDSGKLLARDVMSEPEEELGPQELSPEHISLLRRVVRQWTGSSGAMMDLRREILELAGRVWVEKTRVPHYDLSDPDLRPYLEGVELRAARVGRVRKHHS